MSSTAETPSIEQKGSCRCSREPPWKISKECSEFKSRTPRFAPRLAESVAFRAATRPLTGQQWQAGAYFLARRLMRNKALGVEAHVPPVADTDWLDVFMQSGRRR